MTSDCTGSVVDCCCCLFIDATLRLLVAPRTGSSAVRDCFSWSSASVGVMPVIVAAYLLFARILSPYLIRMNGKGTASAKRQARSRPANGIVSVLNICVVKSGNEAAKRLRTKPWAEMALAPYSDPVARTPLLIFCLVAGEGDVSAHHMRR